MKASTAKTPPMGRMISLTTTLIRSKSEPILRSKGLGIMIEILLVGPLPPGPVGPLPPGPVGAVPPCAYTKTVPIIKNMIRDRAEAKKVFFILFWRTEKRIPRFEQDAGYSVNDKPGRQYPQVADEHFHEDPFGLIARRSIAAGGQKNVAGVSESGDGEKSGEVNQVGDKHFYQGNKAIKV